MDTGPLMYQGFPRIVLPGGMTIDRPHPEWLLHQLRWRWLLDSWEGGEAYRMATYGIDVRGMPIRNLIRHKREYPATRDQSYAVQSGRPPGSDPATQATDDDYELRRARTPVPSFVAEAVEAHLARIYAREVKREGPPELEDWWETDVDGCGTPIDLWMSGTIAPLLLVLGQLDIIVDLPPAPEGREVRSRADEMLYGLDVPVASYILPENMVWWKLDRHRRYAECLVREVRDDGCAWRHWDAEAWTLYGDDGKRIGATTPHPYGAVPIVRVFDRKRPRDRNIGLPRYEVIAELQREYYNRDSELILSDTTQAHPLLQGPEDYVQPDGTVPIGPNWLLPKKKSTTGTGASYEGFDVVEFPKDGAESIRENKHDLRDAADRAACLTKPAGSDGTSGQTVSQSGVSKQMDQSTGNDLLGQLARTLEGCEDAVADLYWLVAGRGDPAPADVEGTTVQYPTEFDLYTATELADVIGRIQMILATMGEAPEVEAPLVKRLVRLALPGLDDDEYALMDADIDRVAHEPPPEPPLAASDQRLAASEDQRPVPPPSDYQPLAANH